MNLKVKMGAPSFLGFLLDRTFFGLEPRHRIQLHDHLFELLWWGDGRWDWDTIYNMPIFLRKFWTRKLNEKLNPPDKPKPAQKSPADNVHRGPDARSKYKK
tara:strand:+ start:39 stop:341 length:303 start_codon:yes stop_codon:yes gene_type:complete